MLNTCLRCYYEGETHMYRPMAGQLRILLCDSSPLFSRVFPDLRIEAVRGIEWAEPGGKPVFEEGEVVVEVDHPPNQEFHQAHMPFLITRYANGLQVADIDLVKGGHLLPLTQWVTQLVTVHPRELTIRDIIKSVADKGGGAHVDDWPNDSLATMQSTGPGGVGSHVLYTVALARLAQQFGLYYTQFRERFGFKGKLEDAVAGFDPEHPSVGNKARVSDTLETRERSIYRYSVLKRIS